MIVAAPILGKSGRVIAALIVTLDPARDFTKIIRLGHLGRSGLTYAFDRRALVLTDNRFDGQRDPSSDGPGVLLRQLRVPGDGPRTSWPLTRMARSAIAGESGVDLQGYRDHRGIPVIGAWVWDRHLRIGLATEMDVAEAYESWYTIRKLTLMMLLVIGAAGAGMFVIMVHHGRVAARGAAYQQAATARQEALAVVSHELRNPLNTVALGSLALLNSIPTMFDETQGEMLRRHLERIRRAAGLMNQLIRDLLESAKLQMGHVRLELRECDVQEIVDQTIDLIGPMAGEKSIRIKRGVAPGVTSVRADPTRLTQVLSNLLTNAVKFTPEGGVIEVQADPSREDVQFRVCDTGPGIPEDELPHIFDPYWQAQRTEKMGTGLGLFIAKSLVELHGGTIRVASELGRGTAFQFTIPRLDAARPSRNLQAKV